MSIDSVTFNLGFKPPYPIRTRAYIITSQYETLYIMLHSYILANHEDYIFGIRLYQFLKLTPDAQMYVIELSMMRLR